MRRLLLGAGLLLASLVAWADVPPIPALTARVTHRDPFRRPAPAPGATARRPGSQERRAARCAAGPDHRRRFHRGVRGAYLREMEAGPEEGRRRRPAAGGEERPHPAHRGRLRPGRAITDVQAGRIISEQITPQFRQGNFYGGIQAGVDSLVQLIDAEKNPDSATASAPVDALPAVPEATPPRALPAPVDEGEVYDSARRSRRRRAA